MIKHEVWRIIKGYQKLSSLSTNNTFSYFYQLKSNKNLKLSDESINITVKHH